MRKILKWILSKIIDCKIYINRTMSWISIANSLMLVFLVVEKLSSLEVIKSDLSDFFIAVIIVWFVILVVLGWFDIKKLNIPHKESVKALEFNPPLKFMYVKIGEINDRTKTMEAKINELERRE